MGNRVSGRNSNGKVNPQIIAAIDLGTNSMHMVVARVELDGHLSVLDTDKVNLRLGQLIGPGNAFSQEIIDRVVDAIRHMKDIASSYNCRIRAVATHATRVVTNHRVLLDSIKAATGLDVEIIDGIEEARLSFLGMRYGLMIGGGLCLGADVGGGSSEIIVAQSDDIKFVTSLKVGAVVLTKMFFTAKGPSKSSISDALEYIEDRIAPFSAEIRKYSVEKAVIASGTAKALAAVHFRMKQKIELSDANAYILSQNDVFKTVEYLENLRDPEKIRSETGLDSNRSEIVLAGALIIKSLTKRLNVSQWHVSTFGLREGVVLDTNSRWFTWARGDHGDVRWKSVESFARRLQIDEDFASHVSMLALCIFDGIAERCFPKLDAEKRLEMREILHATAYLHEVGKFLSYSRYHRHSYYLIANSSLLGFTQDEKQLMGFIARYHRKGAFSANSDDAALVSPRMFGPIAVLSGVLRLAAIANRARQKKISDIKVVYRGEQIEFVLRHKSQEIPEVEFHMATKEINPLQKSLGLDVSISLEPC